MTLINTQKFTAIFAGASLSMVMLSGCIVIKSGGSEEAATVPSSASTPATAPETASPTARPTSTSTSTPSSKTVKPTKDFFDAKDSEIQYAVANPHAGMLAPAGILFGPWMTQVIIDGNSAYTQRYLTCKGEAVTEATGVLELDGEDGQVVRWDSGDDPFAGNAKSETTKVTIDSAKVRMNYQEDAVLDVDGQREAFIELCADYGDKPAAVFETSGIVK